MITRIRQWSFWRSVSTLVDPLFEECDLIGGKCRAFVLRRHSRARFAGEHGNEVTVGRFAGHDRGTSIAARDQFSCSVDTQPRLFSQGTVTRVTTRGQYWFDLLDVVDLKPDHRKGRQEREGRNENDRPSHATPECWVCSAGG